MNPANAEKEPEVKIIPSETPKEQEKIEIDAQSGKPVNELPTPAPSVSPEDFKKMQARMEYHARQNENLQRQLSETLNRLGTYQQPPAIPEKRSDDDEFDQVLDAQAKQNYQKAFRTIASQEAKKIAQAEFKALMDQERKTQLEYNQRNQTASQIDRARNWALERTPSLNDETSEEFKGYHATYSKMLSEDPSLIINPQGPRLVWHEWNESLSKKTSKVDTQEEARLQRVSAGQVATNRPVTHKKTFQLTQDEIDFCKNNGLSPARYAEMKDANLKEGVSA